MLVRGRVGRLQPACKPCKSLSYRVIFIELKTALLLPVLIYLQLVQGTQDQINAHPLPMCTCDVNEILIAWKKQTTKVFFRSTTLRFVINVWSEIREKSRIWDQKSGIKDQRDRIPRDHKRWIRIDSVPGLRDPSCVMYVMTVCNVCNSRNQHLRTFSFAFREFSAEYEIYGISDAEPGLNALNSWRFEPENVAFNSLAKNMKT